MRRTLQGLSCCFYLSMLASPLGAQSPQELTERATQLAKQLHELGGLAKPDAAQQQQLAAAEKQLATLVAEAAAAKDWTVDHFVQASSPLLEARAAQALAISEAGLQRFPDARFLWDHAGMSHLQLAVAQRPSAARVTELRAAEKAFREALKHEPATFHAHAGLFQTLDLLGDVAGAAASLAQVLQDEQGKQALPQAWMHQVALALRSGKARDALPVLDAVDPAAVGEAPLVPAILRVRALAIAKDLPATEAAIAAMLELEDSARTQLEAADALFFVGKKADAQKVLGKLPPLGKWESADERIGQLLAQSGAALAAYWATSDVTAKGPLRGALTKALDHHFLVMDPTAKPKAKEVELSSSPRAMAYLLTQAPESEEKGWANRVLMVLCLQAWAEHKPAAFEAKLLAQVDKKPATADDIPCLLLTARNAIGHADQCGVLTGLHAMERIAAAKAPAGK